MALREFIQAQYGIRTDVIENTYTIGTTPSRILDNNPNRISAAISVLSGGNLYISGKPSVSTSSGAFIGVGAAASLDWRTDADTAGYDMYGIASQASTVVYVREVVIIDDKL